ncbi:chemotaxis protein CheA [Echinimonas agarilytica]|uniref:Chemotaxis protein CheA n=1 Tax=Echinimonas agarilytica TaxID=1215918 RepID=A0AA41W4U1_9GAMM|nr:chemotaxis protein CheA [Echinimonas agarilytica]MCM2678987.1 chemotaxis protein CheA [Echinimonas agarilytica]
MSYDLDEDILQDFLVEAAEILEQLQEQLVELENNPEDSDLLNAIFRGFHTVKGGAGFLSLTELVDACHGAENVFDILRNGQRAVTSELMDVILQALDAINEMFVQVQNREALSAADPAILAELHRLSSPEAEVAPAAPEVPAPTVTPEPTPEVIPESNAADTAIGPVDDINDDDFERLLDELHGKGGSPTAASAQPLTTPSPAPAAPAASSGMGDDITDDEFEALLDELHGKGSFSAAEEAAAAPVPTPDSGSTEDTISDDEFEALLDELHGKGGSPNPGAADVAQTAPEIPAPAAPAAETPVPAPEPVVAKPKPAAAAPAAPKEKDAPKAPMKPSQGETTVRVDTARLDQIMNMVGELVLVRNRLLSLGLTHNDEEMGKAIANLDVVTADLQGAVMQTRMQPIKKVFGRFPRVVRDLARSLKKEIKLELEGEDTDLDKNLVEALADPLVHLVRNSVDHGIEMPDIRAAAGKDRTGIVKLSASQEGDHILLTITDDGAGMDAERLKGIAIDRGVLDADSAARLSNEDAYNLIFAPGFSTKTEISDISGRGVGMDVVKTKITQLNGSVHITSDKGVGTRLEIKVPLTLAIMPTLMVVVGKQTFALPLASVNEIFHLDLGKTNVVDGQVTVVVRDRAIPLFYLDQWLVKFAGGEQDRSASKGHVVIVQVGMQQIGFVVDALIGQEEVVIKPLGTMLQGTPGMAGATITSDGGIALILDVPSLLKFYARKS